MLYTTVTRLLMTLGIAIAATARGIGALPRSIIVQIVHVPYFGGLTIVSIEAAGQPALREWLIVFSKFESIFRPIRINVSAPRARCRGAAWLRSP